MLSSAAAIAHQGGWDEALMALTPVALLVGLVWVATVRARGEVDGDGGSDRR